MQGEKKKCATVTVATVGPTSARGGLVHLTEGTLLPDKEKTGRKKGEDLVKMKKKLPEEVLQKLQTL